jgi:SAM-dependent methyltransferase
MPTCPPRYRELVEHYEACLAAHGDTHRGVDWPNAADAATRYRVMLGLLDHPSRPADATLLDFGCGAGHLVDHLRAHGPADVRYRGADLSPRFVELCREKFPSLDFRCVDILREPEAVSPADFVVANGVFTEKRSLSWDAMWEHTRRMLVALFSRTRVGLAFNVMSWHVDWQRDDLFHLPCDTLLAFLKAEVSRHVVLRADYGLWEYTAYVYREPG